MKKVVEKENLTWRSFADTDGEIAARWNLTATPTLYVLDANGLIRHKWVGGVSAKTMDDAIEKLVREVEQQEK